MHFKTVRDLVAWIEEHGSYTFSSKPKKLSRARILLFSIASGDFNPAHCMKKFAKYSKLGGIVSHGIGTLARAEAEFVQSMGNILGTPVENIAAGSEGFKYLKPLRLGDTYHYEFTLSNPRERNDGWKFDCFIACKAGKAETKVIAEYHWTPLLVEHPELPEDIRKFLVPKTYGQNLREIFLWGPARVASYTCVIAFAITAYFASGVAITERSISMEKERMEKCQAQQWEYCISPMN